MANVDNLVPVVLVTGSLAVHHRWPVWAWLVVTLVLDRALTALTIVLERRGA